MTLAEIPCRIIYMDDNFDAAVAAYCEYLAEDFIKTSRTGETRVGATVTLSYGGTRTFQSVPTRARKYLPIISVDSGTSAHSFIVVKDDPTTGFKRGDILKAASWKAPATNFIRGTIFDPTTYARITWAGGFPDAKTTPKVLHTSQPPDVGEVTGIAWAI